MKILYAGAIGQKNTATSVHVLRNARLLEKMGNTVFFCCEYPIQGEALVDLFVGKEICEKSILMQNAEML